MSDLCYHKNLPQGKSSANSNVEENDYVECPDCKEFVEICWYCGGMVDVELYNDEGFTGNMCQNMDMSSDGCAGVDMENMHVDEDSAEWVPNEC